VELCDSAHNGHGKGKAKAKAIDDPLTYSQTSKNDNFMVGTLYALVAQNRIRTFTWGGTCLVLTRRPGPVAARTRVTCAASGASWATKVGPSLGKKGVNRHGRHVVQS
jgi:hypothetical protein